MGNGWPGLEPHLRELFDSDQIEYDAARGGLLGFSDPLLCVHPTEADQIAALLRLAGEQRLPVTPIGHGSALWLGNRPAEPPLLLALDRMNAVVDYEPRDLTGIFQAGTALSQVQEVLQAEGQFLALDPPHVARATVGGLTATNLSGPIRARYGTPRDLCLGVRVVLTDGTVVRGGGRAVKNVAGYDLTRLFVGSMGTLGVLIEAAYRLHPLPETQGSVLSTFSRPELAQEAARDLLHAPLEPLFFEALNPSDPLWGGEWDGAGPSLWIGFGGAAEAVAAQEERVAEIVRRVDPAVQLRRLNADETARGHARLLYGLDQAHRDAGTMVLRVGGWIQTTWKWSQRLRRLAQIGESGVQCVSHVPSGVVYGLIDCGGTDPARWCSAIKELQAEAKSQAATVVVESAPRQIQANVDVWGVPTGPASLMRAIRDRLDPHRVLNRGRLGLELEPEPTAQGEV